MAIQARPTEPPVGINSEAGAGVLRFITCGSVDDGKSTLIGRLLYDSKLLFDDQITKLERESAQIGSADGGLDFALLLDGLEAEREQGITIDVAYRYFNTLSRKFIVADTPGHEQYTRNMATGASTADLAVILVDARKGLLTQTRRHAYIASMMGIRHVVAAVNKMDLIAWSEAEFVAIDTRFQALAGSLGFESFVSIPISARFGDNVFTRSAQCGWYGGPTLMERLETVNPGSKAVLAHPFRFPVQWVNRPNANFRGFAGTIAAGSVRPGDAVLVAHSAKSARVSRIVTADGDLALGEAGQAVTLVLDREIDIARGDLLVDPDARCTVASQFVAEILWMGEEPMLPGRPYLFKSGGQTCPVSITDLKHKIDVNTYERSPAKQLELNEIGSCALNTARAIAFDPYKDLRETGSFILIDRYTNQTVAAGMIDFALRRATNIHFQAMDVDKALRSAMKRQSPAILWFTGLSGAGKSTIANAVERRLAASGRHTYALDGDNIRHGLNKDLGFTPADRVENIRRIGEVARLMVDAGLIVTCSFISPFRSERRLVRELVGPGEFIEVFVDAPIEVCASRDPKGLYRKAAAGEIKNFTGIDSPYEPPETPEIHIRSDLVSLDEAAECVLAFLETGLPSPRIGQPHGGKDDQNS